MQPNVYRYNDILSSRRPFSALRLSLSLHFSTSTLSLFYCLPSSSNFLIKYMFCSYSVIRFHSLRLIGFGMMWLYRKNKYTVMDIQGLSVDKWRERQRTRQQTRKTKAAHTRTSSETASVHYSITGDSVVIGLDNANQR